MLTEEEKKDLKELVYQEVKRFHGCLYKNPTAPNKFIPHKQRPSKVIYIAKGGVYNEF